GYLQVAVLLVPGARFLVGPHPGFVQDIPDHAQLVECRPPVGGELAAVAQRSLAAQPGPEPEPALADVSGRDAQVPVLLLPGAGVAVALVPGRGGTVDDADAQRL